jgi:hypothetical protein
MWGFVSDINDEVESMERLMGENIFGFSELSIEKKKGTLDRKGQLSIEKISSGREKNEIGHQVHLFGCCTFHCVFQWVFIYKRDE